MGNRVVGVYEYGDPSGAPVFAFHGTPSCGAGFAWADGPAKERGLRVVAPDRPGVGRSTRARWTVAGYPEHVVALADAMGIERFAVWGYSGGGPYAVACAALLPERVSAVAVSAGMGQMGVWAQADDFEKTDRQLLGLSRRWPGLARLVLGTTARLAKLSPKSAVKSFEKELSPADREVTPTLGSPAETIALFTEAFTNGAYGVVADYLAIAEPWGLDLESITVPMTIWHGDEDTMVPLRHSEELARRVGTATMTVWPHAGHLGTITHVAEILDALRR
ncbi:MAG: hypothetical protein QOE35_3938 [Actinomycetota bacterium]